MYYKELVPLKKGWADDQKYYVVDEAGARHLLRISPMEKYDYQMKCFLNLQKIDVMGLPICRPEAFGRSPEGVYTMLSWIDGKDAEVVVPELPAEEQYALGVKAGQILKRIHTIPANPGHDIFEVRFSRKVDRKINDYREGSVKYAGGETFIAYIEAHRDLVKGRPQCFQHGDYHINNMMIEDGEIRIIDFDRYDFGDPWEEFQRIPWTAKVSPVFATGMVDGYFDGEVPAEFWPLLALYTCANTLATAAWAVPYGEEEIVRVTDLADKVYAWYEGMTRVIPTWYQKP